MVKHIVCVADSIFKCPCTPGSTSAVAGRYVEVAWVKNINYHLVLKLVSTYLCSGRK